MNAPAKTRAVVFDLDDTLYAERDYVRGGYQAVAEHLRSHLGCTEVLEDWLWRRFISGLRNTHPTVYMD